MLQKICEMDKEICVPYATYGCPKQLHIIQTIHNKPKLKGQRLGFQGSHNGHCSENDRARREDNKDREHNESLASTLTALTPSLCKGPSVKDPVEHLQGATQISYNGSSSTKWGGGEEGMASIRCRVCSAHKQRKVTSFIGSTCEVALHKTPCFGEYHMKKNNGKGTQKMNMSLDIYPNISHKNLSCNIICTDVKKLIYTVCIFACQSVGEI